jgi:hypothetical protein
MRLLKITTIATALASTLISGNVMAELSQIAIYNLLGKDVGITCQETVSTSGGTSSGTISYNHGTFYTTNPDDPTVGISKVTCSMNAPEGETPYTSEFNFTMDCSTGTCMFSIDNPGASWLTCTGIGCDAGTDGIAESHPSMTLTYTSSTTKTKRINKIKKGLTK